MSQSWFLTAACIVAILSRATAAETSSPVIPASLPETATLPAPVCSPTCKVVVPTVEKRKNHRICYDCKEVDFVPTRCVKTPIPTHDCPDGDCSRRGPFGFLAHCFGQCPGADGPACIQCGKPHTYKVLIKKVITEEVEVPACKVERVPVQPYCPEAR